jgi:type II secretory pathway pseudopilin PulG
MYEISLLPAQYKQQLTEGRKKNDLIISFVFTLIILSILCILAFSVSAVTKNDLAQIKNENLSLQSEISSLSNYRSLQDEVANIKGNLQTLAKDAPSFPHVLSEITQSVPTSLQLTKITFTLSQETMTYSCKITGNAAYYDDASSWINILNGIEDIGEVYCSYTNSSTANSLTRVQFELNMDILDKNAVGDIVWQPVNK